MISIRNEKGAALVMVIFIGILVVILSMVTILSTKNSSEKVSSRRDNVSAFNIAEAGKEYALAGIRVGDLVPEADETITIVPKTAFEQGFYTVVCRANEDITSLWLTSTGETRTQKKTIEVTCNAVMYVDIEAYEYLILTDGEFKHENFGHLDLGIGGKAHMNGPARFQGVFNLTGDFSSSVSLDFEQCLVYGNVTAPDIETSMGAAIYGSVTEEAVPEVGIPTIDWTPYRQRAVDYDELISGDYFVSAIEDLEPAGGVIWVDGNVKFESTSGGTIKGCIIATGWILIESENTLTQTKVDNLPAFVSTTSSVKKEVQIADLHIEGLVYAETDVLLENNGSLTGSVMCKGDCAIENDWSLTYTSSIPSLTTGIVELNTCQVLSWREL